MNRRPNNQQGSGPGSGSGNQDRNRNRRRRGGGGGGNQQGSGGGGQRPQRQAGEAQAPVEIARTAPPVMRRYGIIFYDNHAQAREDMANLLEKSKEVDQLNIVIRAEGTMDDPELLKYGKIFAGEAWHLIHRRRVDDKWYDEPHE
ncbi:MAG TPA: hypothetical protein VE954_21460 [Oligoflexus sp.]|uniref:hypothetical protein n=1 Tax=Oligoflexus sp. TaxID=1971216 RepID=UPI002D5E1F0E|nr:hypothetical protein [Oligoflexus sp.]HYX35672.1 hypothetical protein [Oligoflexus sp.]